MNFFEIASLNLKSLFRRKSLFTSFLTLFLLASLLQSCGDVGCVEPFQFFDKTFFIESNPSNLKNINLYGTYGSNPNNAGQSSDWQETNLRSNGDQFIIKISGAWVAQNATEGDGSNIKLEDLATMPTCPMCTRIETSIDQQFCNNSPPSDTTNCFCQDQVEDQFLNGYDANGSYLGYFTPKKLDSLKVPTEIDCQSSEYDNPEICSCKPLTKGSKLDDENYYHYSLFSYKKGLGNCDSLVEDTNSTSSKNQCAFRQGRYGLISLWGESGNETPERVYDLFTLKKICRLSRDKHKINRLKRDKSGAATQETEKVVAKNVKGEDIESCNVKDSNGNIVGDGWDYFYESKDGKIFKKNDTTYHVAGEIVKLKMLDNYYSDNFGGYTITFLSGVTSDDNFGLIEKIVSSIETMILGTYNPETGERNKNGIVEFMYKALVSDNYFINTVRMALVLYICFFGVGYMLGVVEIKTKDIVMRMIKFGLVLTFTTYSGWSMYKLFVVDFFKDGMDSLITLVTNLFDNFMGGDTSILYKKSSGGVGYGSRFSYADTIIRDITSSAAAKKIWGLFFMKGGSAFGLLYIIAIYALVLYFIYVMVTVALTYIVNLIKLVFAISLGPIFISFSLFSKTEQMYKNWLGFIGARSLEMMILFISLYPFLIVINNTFKEMLFYRACAVDWVIGPGSATVLISEIDRSLFGWFYFFIKIGALTFLINSMIGKSSELSGQLINIGGVPNRDSGSLTPYGSSTFSLASGIMQTILKDSISALRSKYIAGAAASVMKDGVSLTTRVIRNTGIGDYFSKQLSKVPVIGQLANYPGIRTMMRNRIIDQALVQATAEANAAGLTGAKRDEAIRESAIQTLRQKMFSNPNTTMALGLDLHNIDKRFEQKLVVEPLKNYIKLRAAELKADTNLLGKDLRKQLRQDASIWCNKNMIAGGAKAAENYLKKNNPNSILDYVRRKAEYRTSEAITKFGNDQDLRKQYLDELQKNEARLERKQFGEERSPAKIVLFKAGNLTRAMKDKIVGGYKWRRQNLHLNPKQQRKRFLDKLTKRGFDEISANKLYREAIVQRLLVRDKNNKIPGVNIERNNTKIDANGNKARLPKSYDELKTQAKLVRTRDLLYKNLDQDIDKKLTTAINQRKDEIRKELLKTNEKAPKDQILKQAHNQAKDEFYDRGKKTLFDKNDSRTLFEKVAEIENLRDDTPVLKRAPESRETGMEKRNQLAEIIGARAKEVDTEIKTLDPVIDKQKIDDLKTQQENLQKGLLASQMDDTVKSRFEQYLNTPQAPLPTEPEALTADQKERVDAVGEDRFTRIRNLENILNNLSEDSTNESAIASSVSDQNNAQSMPASEIIAGGNFGAADGDKSDSNSLMDAVSQEFIDAAADKAKEQEDKKKKEDAEEQKGEDPQILDGLAETDLQRRARILREQQERERQTTTTVKIEESSSDAKQTTIREPLLSQPSKESAVPQTPIKTAKTESPPTSPPIETNKSEPPATAPKGGV